MSTLRNAWITIAFILSLKLRGRAYPRRLIAANQFGSDDLGREVVHRTVSALAATQHSHAGASARHCWHKKLDSGALQAAPSMNRLDPSKLERKLTMNYVDGFVAAVPTANRDACLNHAQLAAAIFKECGALSTVECWGDDVPEGKLTHNPKLGWPGFPLSDKWQVAVARRLESTGRN